jgi:hypothetical protein
LSHCKHAIYKIKYCTNTMCLFPIKDPLRAKSLQRLNIWVQCIHTIQCNNKITEYNNNIGWYLYNIGFLWFREQLGEFVFCNLFVFKEKQRQMQIKKMWQTYTILHRQKTFNLPKQTFYSIALKFQTPSTVSNGNHFLYILYIYKMYILFV